MKIKDILLSMPAKEVYKSVRKEHKGKSRKQYREYIKCINELKKRSLETCEDDNYKGLELTLRWRCDIPPCCEKWYDVYLKSTDITDESMYSFDCISFLDFVNLKINDETLKKYKTRKIIGHAIWELTYLGFSEDSTINFMDKMYYNIANEREKNENN